MMGDWFSLLVSLLDFLCLALRFTNGSDTIHQGQTITYPNTLISSGGKFELGFFSPVNTSKYYLGIWHKVSKQPIVWVANREYPCLSDSSNLTINSEGKLVISDGPMSYQVTRSIASNDSKTFAKLLDSGNLVLQDTTLAVVWQSFDFPTDAILSGMNLGQRNDTEIVWSLVSWKSREDPAPGSFSLGLNSDGQLVVEQGSKTYWTGFPSLFKNYSIDVVPQLNESLALWRSHPADNYITWNFIDPSKIMHIVLDRFGELKLESWSEDDRTWHTLKSSKCSHRQCGVYSICNIIADKPCSCLKGFKPFPANNWTKDETSKGCVRKTDLQCSNSTTGGSGFQNYGFYRMAFVNFSSAGSVNSKNISSAVDCKADCFSNCSCLAYSYDLNLGCLQWCKELFDLKQLAINDSDGKNFYLKLPNSELTKDISLHSPTKDHKNTGNRMQLWIILILTISLSMLILGLFIHYVRRKLQMKGEDLLKLDLAMSLRADDAEFTEANMRHRRKPEVKLPLFSFASVSAATDNFAPSNKLGEGGFGPVYKGILLKGDEVAVKRLSKRSGQGWEELKNEALVIAKLQHKNLVRLLGCCLDKDEKILIYEYMPNKSLDFFLFDSAKRMALDWEIRARIIEGVAQGLLYLHQYSRLRIIHRDLKASNILLDNNMNPKISDFGMARIFGGDELQANTNRIVGTYGYMSPEYAFEGCFSIKSDVFSFGVLLLEILSGKKNTGFYQSDSLHLLGYAWDLWISNRGLELIDSMLKEVPTHLAIRYINIGLLCVQESAEDRPNMFDVVSMLNNQTMILLSPKQPAFLNVRSMANPNLIKSRPETSSVNDVTFSAFQTRT